jgi:beta-mannanase
MHEMDGTWYPWSGYSRGNTPEEFVDAWRRIHDLFHDEGATNVTWVWSVNHRSVPHIPANRVEEFWPGSRYVDWIGISGFNPGPVRVPFRWQSFDHVNRSRYLELLQYDKPIMISETAAPEVGGDKAAWVARMFRSISARYPKLGALIWFDDRDPKFPTRNDWRINSSKRVLRVFRRALEGPHLLSAPAGIRITERAR